ncbi:MAG: 3-deoxy-manno-octulosonate cytidylyltransferase [Oligoflexales bacterium]|nr:3-deoxy-manno-octulosonate cytidylyltransferase [Oligoflexales bacterium]
MKALCVIPSRIASTRLARKPLLPIHGKPMIQWVYEKAKACTLLEKVIVATDSLEIADLIGGLGGDVMMTSPDIQTGSDRVAVVAKSFPDMDVVINLQGDEPFIKPSMLNQVLAPYLAAENPDMSTLAYELSEQAYNDPGAVKVILDCKGYAIYFSRAPIPYYRQAIKAPVFHHMGLYAFRYDFLMKYTTLQKTPLEHAESLEQLRALENGYKIRVCLTEHKTIEVNTPEDYEKAKHMAMN